MTRLYAIIIAILAVIPAATALPPDHFAAHSVLAQGRWVKISVPSTGLYCITPAQLRSWGFSDISAVRVYGYGGRRMPDELTAANTIDDLPMVQTRTTSRGIVFYAVGPDELSSAAEEYFTVKTSPYTTAGYYFVSDSGTPSRDIPQSGISEATDPAESFVEVRHHEIDRVSPGEAGALLLGEEFRLTPRRNFTFETPDRVDTARVWLQCSFAAVTPSAPSYVNFRIDGETLPRAGSDRIPIMSGSSYQHAMMTVTQHTFHTPSSGQLKIEIEHSSPSSAVYNAWLDYITVCYRRRLAMPASGALEFRSSRPRMRLEGGGASGVEIWDVTDPLQISRINAGTGAGGAAVWTSDYIGLRHYAAHSETAALPQPEFVKTVSCSDLHATPGGMDMVIITPAAFRAAAERIAALHRAEPDTMQVLVADAEQIYNEFGSGVPDVSAFRKFLKMLYDRGNAAGRPLRYALLMGRPTYDHRRLTADMQKASWPTLPSWITREYNDGLNDNSGFTTDDFIAMLDDGSGGNLAADSLRVSVGRIGAATAADASAIVDKMERYIHKSARTPWKNVLLALADDDDRNIHITQTECFEKNLLATPGVQLLVDKIYVDAYPLVGGVCKQGREEMFRRLDDGVVWWNFVGHATNHSWTREEMLTYTDINNIYLRNVPFVYAATCDFLRWDSNTVSGAEIMHAEPNGGCIGIISATRPVYIDNNGLFTAAVARWIARRDSDGSLMRVGDIYRHAKNDIRRKKDDYDELYIGPHTADSNRLRYVLAGDPAMRLATPSNIVRIDSIDGVPFDPETQPTLAALQQAVVSGHVETPDGRLIDSFNGTATIDLYDADRSFMTLGQAEHSEAMPYDTHGSKLLSVSAPVSGGRFHARVAMPADISDNFRPATLNVYAGATDGSAEAVGVCRDLYVYGVDETAPVDTKAPEINSYVINHSGFRSGDAVSTHTPMALASVSDDTGINISSAGVGHQMTLTLDSITTYNDVALYYTPHPDGTPGGTIVYPMPDMEPGLHNLRLRVWDTSGNAAEQTLEFFAKADLAPQIFDLYSDANPARTAANFYITHDAPDAMATVTVTVYNMLGNPVWTRTVQGRSDMFTSTPVSWDLRDGSGRRVARGIYVYSATITVDGTTHRTSSRKLAVTDY